MIMKTRSHDVQLIQHEPISMLDKVPEVVLRELICYLDIGTILSLSQVNKNLRDRLSPDDSLLWSTLVRNRLEKVTFSADEEAFGRMIRWTAVLRCSTCMVMEEGRPLMDPLQRQLICEPCKQDPAKNGKFQLISTTTAKNDYFLTDEELLPLPFVSSRNPYFPRRGPAAHYYSRR
jgi:hypothetical protein